MEYTIQTVANEFKFDYNKITAVKYAEFLNEYYDLVKNLETKIIKSILPINHKGFGDSYLDEDKMITEIIENDIHVFKGCIFNIPQATRETVIVISIANNKKELYERMLIQYMNYLSNYKKYEYAENEFNKIVNLLNEYKNGEEKKECQSNSCIAVESNKTKNIYCKYFCFVITENDCKNCHVNCTRNKNEKHDYASQVILHDKKS